MARYKHLDTLRELVTLHGGPGFEQQVRDRIQTAFSEYTTDLRVDTLGNLIGVIPGEGPGPRPRILLSAHMDEIALVVSRIEAGGFLRVAQAGGFDPRTLVGQEVFVHTRTGKHLGIVGSKPPHLTAPEERGKAAALEDLFIDLAHPEASVRDLVAIGDRVTLAREVYSLRNDRLAGKSLDNRTSVAIILETLEVLKKLHHTADVYAVASVQEEVGVRGAATVGYGVNPDIAIAIDVTFGDFPGQAFDEGFELDGGPALSYGPNLHMKVFRHLTEVADREGIPYQVELSQGPVGADARAFQIARAGIASALIGIPLRYMHTSVETGAYRDIALCGRLLAQYIADVDAARVEDLSCY
ncbi:M42 family peptidase [Alicyclobacillus fastidiosus]|uniref:M42 family peptidase n=1 Tax=Alicyclobacillus fastidiosus TaxID=392011 RepID=A0ABY6ZA97_9BACL|nr:M42 family peptidase [Alicyclobacillus fastidiosus]WAH39655.1 M42 family peptidase [Alicyclobacillus fastidiosus]